MDDKDEKLEAAIAKTKPVGHHSDACEYDPHGANIYEPENCEYCLELCAWAESFEQALQSHRQTLGAARDKLVAAEARAKKAEEKLSEEIVRYEILEKLCDSRKEISERKGRKIIALLERAEKAEQERNFYLARHDEALKSRGVADVNMELRQALQEAEDRAVKAGGALTNAVLDYKKLKKRLAAAEQALQEKERELEVSRRNLEASKSERAILFSRAEKAGMELAASQSTVRRLVEAAEGVADPEMWLEHNDGLLEWRGAGEWADPADQLTKAIAAAKSPHDELERLLERERGEALTDLGNWCQGRIESFYASVDNGGCKTLIDQASALKNVVLEISRRSGPTPTGKIDIVDEQFVQQDSKTKPTKAEPMEALGALDDSDKIGDVVRFSGKTWGGLAVCISLEGEDGPFFRVITEENHGDIWCGHDISVGENLSREARVKAKPTPTKGSEEG